MSTLTAHSRPLAQRSSYSRQIALVMTAAFVLSIAHSVYSDLTHIGDPSWRITSPAPWIYYAVGFAAVAFARRESRAAQWVLLGYLGLLLVVSVFYYPTTFVVKQQTVFGWFENDVYTGLLMVAAYLCCLRLHLPVRKRS